MNFQTPDFSTDYNTIIERTENINALPYSKTRNFLNGGVTYLSAYISRGVISLPYVKDQILSKHPFKQVYKLIQELAWREYFQRVWEARPELVMQDVKHEPTQLFDEVPVNITQAQTGIESIDKGMEHLRQTGYMHNHLRMYTAMLTCNIAQTKWQQPAAWMYYHLLDGDIASNNFNWQWVAGTFSHKRYLANQENINRYSQTNQSGTYLDRSYDELAQMEIPPVFNERQPFNRHTVLPAPLPVVLDHEKPLLIYNSYNLDPLWQHNATVNRVLLLDPGHFKKNPVSEKVLSFILSLSRNINGIQVFNGSFDELRLQYKGNTSNIIFKKHPLNEHYKGTAQERDWMFPEVSGYFSSFSSYWKEAEPYLM